MWIFPRCDFEREKSAKAKYYISKMSKVYRNERRGKVFSVFSQWLCVSQTLTHLNETRYFLPIKVTDCCELAVY